jgi:hypothetical protein
MFETSKDILNIVIAGSVGLLAIFTCWAIYYLARILEQGFKILKEMRERIGKIDELVRLIRKKVEHSTSHIVLISEGIKKLVEVIRERKEK